MPDQGGAGGGVNDAGGVPQAEPAPAAPETKPEGEDSMDGKRDGRETFLFTQAPLCSGGRPLSALARSPGLAFKFCTLYTRSELLVTLACRFCAARS